MTISQQLHCRIADFATLIAWSSELRFASPVPALLVTAITCLSA
jgi:hypothetical protein